MKVLDLFSGHGGFSLAFLNRGHEVTRIDNNPKFSKYVHTLNWDINQLHLNDNYDVVLCSPPCEDFSIANSRWGERDLTNAINLAKIGKEIAENHSKIWILENPRARLRLYLGQPKETIFQCTYGLTSPKPTDLWGNYFEKIGSLRKECKHDEHTYRNLGSNGRRVSDFEWKVQETRAIIPYWLSEVICRKCEKYLN